MICCYHIDNDGLCAGFWVNRLGKRDEYEDCFYVINYGIDFPFDKVHKNEVVYIVDYSISPEEMDKLLEITPNVIWIDHHKTAIEKYANYDKEIAGLRYDGIAGCMLTYIYLGCMCHCDTKEVTRDFDPEMAKSAPMFTKLIADYDVWTFEYGDLTRRFEKGLSLYDREPTSEIWERLESECTIDDIISKKESYIIHICDVGETIISYRRNLMKAICKSKGFETTIGGYKCFAVNNAMMSSDDFVIDNVDDYDLLVGFSFNGELWNYSLRSNKIDCALLAQKFGGGGHKGAAGFNYKTLVFK